MSVDRCAAGALAGHQSDSFSEGTGHRDPLSPTLAAPSVWNGWGTNVLSAAGLDCIV